MYKYMRRQGTQTKTPDGSRTHCSVVECPTSVRKVIGSIPIVAACIYTYINQ